MLNKKDGLVSTATLSIIVVVAAGIFILAIIFPLAEAAGGPALQAAITDLCEFNINVKGSGEADVGVSTGGVGIKLKDVVPTVLCFNRNRVIYADAWKKCDPENYFGLKDMKDRKAARTKCAAIQVATLAKTCFDMYGSDKLDLRTGEDADKPLPCFKFKIKHFGKEELSEGEFVDKGMEALGTDQGFCGYRIFNADGETTSDPYFNDNNCWMLADRDRATGRCQLDACGGVDGIMLDDDRDLQKKWDNVIWGLDIFSAEFGKSEAHLLQTQINDLNTLNNLISTTKPEVQAATKQTADGKLRETTNNLVKIYNDFNTLVPTLPKYVSAPDTNTLVAISPPVDKSLWLGKLQSLQSIKLMADVPANDLKRDIVNILDYMVALVDFSKDSFGPQLNLYKAGYNVMCFNECGEPVLTSRCAELNNGETLSTDLVGINTIQGSSVHFDKDGNIEFRKTWGCKF